ncbi:glucosamine-6-phosphate isomerases/6-phosphogluconolactonase-domain-containing protein [Baffinella frigidus]|nr:glucosamine-6-phosphate isomerases/6-phosphogluconolactonase-domain-containing protein [Cryptophyta sp. CCMP2293]
MMGFALTPKAIGGGAFLLLLATAHAATVPAFHSASAMRLRGGSPTRSLGPSSGITALVVQDVAARVCEDVARIGGHYIQQKGTFSLCIPGGSIVKALGSIKVDALDWSKVHVFFANEQLGAFKCHAGAMEAFILKMGIPTENVHKVPDCADPEEAAAKYAAEIAASHAVTNGAMDLILLGTGEDGHVGSLHPGSAQLKEGCGTGKTVLGITKGDKKSVAVSMDLINSAKNVILSAAGETRTVMANKVAARGAGDDQGRDQDHLAPRRRRRRRLVNPRAVMIRPVQSSAQLSAPPCSHGKAHAVVGTPVQSGQGPEEPVPLEPPFSEHWRGLRRTFAAPFQDFASPWCYGKAPRSRYAKACAARAARLGTRAVLSYRHYLHVGPTVVPGEGGLRMSEAPLYTPPRLGGAPVLRTLRLSSRRVCYTTNT